MEITTRLEKSITIITLRGKLDGTTAPQAQQNIIPLLTSGCRMVFDMAACDYISSAGLRLLLVMAKQLEKIGGTGAFASVHQEVNDVMEMTGFNNIFASYPDVPSAIRSFEGTPAC